MMKCEACEMGYGIELDKCHGYNHALSIIEKVRELAENAFHDGMGREMDDPRFHYRMFAALVLQALDGEQ